MTPRQTRLPAVMVAIGALFVLGMAYAAAPGLLTGDEEISPVSRHTIPTPPSPAITSETGRAQPEPLPPDAFGGKVNPFVNDPAAVERGRVLFMRECAACHGSTGRGEGVGAILFDPPPANLRTGRAREHDDITLFWRISEGVAGTTMPAWRTALTEEGTGLTDEEIWQLIAFLRQLQAEAEEER